MLGKIKALPEKVALSIGLTLILFTGLLLFLLSLLFPIGIWITIITEAVVIGIAFLFIASAADKRHSLIDQKK